MAKTRKVSVALIVTITDGTGYNERLAALGNVPEYLKPERAILLAEVERRLALTNGAPGTVFTLEVA